MEGIWAPQMLPKGKPFKYWRSRETTGDKWAL